VVQGVVNGFDVGVRIGQEFWYPPTFNATVDQ